jgi:hypothetical protein
MTTGASELMQVASSTGVGWALGLGLRYGSGFGGSGGGVGAGAGAGAGVLSKRGGSIGSGGRVGGGEEIRVVVYGLAGAEVDEGRVGRWGLWGSIGHDVVEDIMWGDGTADAVTMGVSLGRVIWETGDGLRGGVTVDGNGSGTAGGVLVGAGGGEVLVG